MADDLLADYKREVIDLKRERDELKRSLDKREDDNKKARDTIKTLESERDGLKTQLPAEGATTLSKADAIRWQSFTALGSLDDVAAKVKGYDGLEAKDKRRAREDGVKSLGYKPSVFEVIAQGKPYALKGEGDDAKVMLTVDDKEVELSEHAKAQGLEDLLSVMALGETQAAPKPVVPTGAGTRLPGEFQALSASERAKQKKNESRYNGI